MFARAGIGLAAVAFWHAAALAQETKRPEWDQKKAVEMVKKIVALEATGQPWDRIAWNTDAARAAALARKEGKPLLVYFFLKKNVGPKAAPC